MTASILATFQRMSNMFLHFRQVIDSKLPNDYIGQAKLWKFHRIRTIKVLNKWDDSLVLLVEADQQILPLCPSSNPQAGLYFLNWIN